MGAPTSRICCILAPSLRMEDASNRNILDPGDLGHHSQSNSVFAGGGKTGLIYMRKLGILDFGHLRDCCDLTKYVYDELRTKCGGSAARRTGQSPGTCTLNTNNRVDTTHGFAEISSALSDADLLPVARSIAYDDALGYEIHTYSIPTGGTHNSSYSPEDLPSNYVGTWVAAQAITRTASNGNKFDDEVDTILKELCKNMEAAEVTGTRRIFDQYIKGKWVSATLNYTDKRYLLRRNFTGDYWDPLIDVATTPHLDPSGAAQGLGNGNSLAGYAGKYRFTYEYLNDKFQRTEFEERMKKNREDAKRVYGPLYDSPSSPTHPIPKPPKPPEDRVLKDREFNRERPITQQTGESRGAAEDRFAASDDMPQSGPVGVEQEA